MDAAGAQPLLLLSLRFTQAWNRNHATLHKPNLTELTFFQLLAISLPLFLLLPELVLEPLDVLLQSICVHVRTYLIREL